MWLWTLACGGLHCPGPLPPPCPPAPCRPTPAPHRPPPPPDPYLHAPRNAPPPARLRPAALRQLCAAPPLRAPAAGSARRLGRRAGVASPPRWWTRLRQLPTAGAAAPWRCTACWTTSPRLRCTVGWGAGPVPQLPALEARTPVELVAVRSSSLDLGSRQPGACGGSRSRWQQAFGTALVPLGGQAAPTWTPAACCQQLADRAAATSRPGRPPAVRRLACP